jgi:hypothetical protein
LLPAQEWRLTAAHARGSISSVCVELTAARRRLYDAKPAQQAHGGTPASPHGAWNKMCAPNRLRGERKRKVLTRRWQSVIVHIPCTPFRLAPQQKNSPQLGKLR